MITVYHKQDGVFVTKEVTPKDAISQNALWIDVESPTADEEAFLKKQLAIDIPTKEEIWKNHVLNRMYVENGVAYMTAAIISKLNTPYPVTSSITFILSPAYLITIREISPTSFKTFIHRLTRSPHGFQSGPELLEGLLEEIITRVAHNSEVVVDELDALSHHIFDAQIAENNGRNPSQVMKDVLRKLGACADLNSKINESLHSLNRMLTFFRETEKNSASLATSISVLVTDAQALTKQTQFLADKITFQLDATLGMINVEQNAIIKIFSVVAVFFLPPTLVSSIYGMNFDYMPELHWFLGYPAAISFMAFCALIPFLYFRKKGWL